MSERGNHDRLDGERRGTSEKGTKGYKHRQGQGRRKMW